MPDLTHRQRFRTILAGGIPDRIAWVPRLDIWFNTHAARGTLPPELQNKTLFEAETFLGMGHSCRNGVVYNIEHEDAELSRARRGDDVIETWRTPVGEISSTWCDPPDACARGIFAIQKDHFIKTDADWEVARYLAAHRRYVPDYEAYRAYDREVGEDGLPLVIIGISPFIEMIVTQLGYERFYHEWFNNPARIEALLEAMQDAARPMWDVVADSPAEFVLHGSHFNSIFTPPPVFEKYCGSYLKAFNDRMHTAGKRVACHADADLSGLLNHVLDCGYDVADCFATAPLVPCTLERAREVWGDRIVVWGAVPAIILEPDYPRADFEREIVDLYDQTAGRPGVIWAVSDNIMPGADFTRLCWIRDFLAQREIPS